MIKLSLRIVRKYLNNERNYYKYMQLIMLALIITINRIV